MTRASSPGEHDRVAGRLAGELGRDTSQLARRVLPCCRSNRRQARPRHEPSRPASMTVSSVDSPASLAVTRASSPASSAVTRASSPGERGQFQTRPHPITMHLHNRDLQGRLESIDTHTATSIDSGHQKSTNIPHDESVDSSPDDWENDYYSPAIDAYTGQNMHTDEYDEDFEEERAIEYRAILDEEDKLLPHSSWKRNAPSFDMTSLPSIDTQPQQRCRKRASTDTAYYKSVDTDFNRVRDGDYSIGSWADEHHHESFAVEIITYTRSR
ncbi:hypothetical protein F2Q69_00014017 [Brassica cretica]|uniref:Uncharacterized protein n=1 Tax=Brassica cretica TaxID=69181 RepID=A0A8S9QUV5_BRACR|nr:hypothetical protein F2Q69_00014017 [Brassica cretica]